MALPELEPPFRAGTAPEPPLGLLALWLAAWSGVDEPLLYVAHSERRARAMANAVSSLAPRTEVLLFPPWDCLPYDRAQPSRAVMGQRMEVLRRLTARRPARLVVTTVGGLAQRVPPPPTTDGSTFICKAGAMLDRDCLVGFLERSGYVIDDRVDEPGEAALRGSVIDLFPPIASHPVRIELDEGAIGSIRTYDALSQRSLGELEGIEIGPASEAVAADEPASGADLHALPMYVPELHRLLDHLPSARLVLDREVDARFEAWTDQIADAYAARQALQPTEAVAGERRPLVEPQSLYLDAEEWACALGSRPALRLEAAVELGLALAPPRTRRELVALVRKQVADGRRVVVAASEPEPWRQLLGARLGTQAAAIEGCREAVQQTPGAVGLWAADLPGGFLLGDLAVIAAPAPAERGGRQPTAASNPLQGEDGLRLGDRVVHREHGIAELQGLEAVETDGVGGEHLVLRFLGDRRLLVTVDELDRIWRYGTAEADVTLDRLDGEAWRQRRDEVAAEVDAAAAGLARLAAERASSSGPRLEPPKDYGRFVRRFPFELSDDQVLAIEATLADLQRGSPPMDRLICGDVGFGKTEVALRAAAIAALNGRQVALLAPTTLLVSQHLQTFRRRFAGLGVTVEQLSRLGRDKELRRVRDGLADGSVRIVVGTHALASPELRFRDLGLVIVDEEQRFGTAQKAALARLRRGVHVLTLTATPIPRTLQAALAGIQDLSVISTAPQRRLPIRTFVLPFDPAVVREALQRERRRGGRSFVVVPRVADLAPMRERLAGIASDLDIAVAHGRMRADELDRTMLGFAEGAHDVLLTTAIIETGLDIPRADTMIVWRPDRFGIAQLHQLRGRVGRGRERAACYLLHEPDKQLPEPVARRLRTLETFESLGAGFAISARDLDLRGAGTLGGEAQAGHVQRIGTGLYQQLLERALRRARGEPVPEEWSPELALGIAASIPADYVPEPELRLDVYAKLARLETEDDLAALAEEVEDRFGSPPRPVVNLLRLAGLRLRSIALDVAKIEVGPKAAAATLRDGIELAPHLPEHVRWSEGRLILNAAANGEDERLANAATLLDVIETASRQRRCRQPAASPKKAPNSRTTSSGASSGR